MPTLRMLSAFCALGHLRQSACLEDALTLVQKTVAMEEYFDSDLFKATGEDVDISLHLDDRSQAEGEDTDVSFGQDSWDGAAICREKDLEEYQKRLDAYTARKATRSARQAARKARRDEAKLERVRKHFAWIDTFTNETLEFLQQKFQPLILRYVKGLFETVDDKPAHWKEINLTQVGWDIEKAFPQLKGKFEASLNKSLREMDVSLNAAVPALPHQVRQLPAFQQALPELEDNGTLWTNYFIYKYLPIVTLEWEPSTAKIVKIIAEMPPTSDPKFPSYLVTQISAMVLGNALKPPAPGGTAPKEAWWAPAPDGESPPPARHCVTCWERYQELSWNIKNPNSCAHHCSFSALSCLGGINDACLVGAVPCLRCQRNRLQQFDGCEHTNSFHNEVGKLSDLMTIFKAGTEGFVPKIGALLAK